MKFFFLKIFLFLFSNKPEWKTTNKKKTLRHAIEASFLNKIQLESSKSNK